MTASSKRPPLALELRGGPDGDDAAVLDRDAAVAHGRPLDRDDPVGRVDDPGCTYVSELAAYASRRASICAAQRFSRKTETQIDSSKSRRSGIDLEGERDRSRPSGRMIATTQDADVADAAVAPQASARSVTPEADEREDEDGQLEDEARTPISPSVTNEK